MVILLITILFLSYISVYLHDGKFVLVNLEDTEKDFLIKKQFCYIASIVWIFLSGFRHESIGADTIAYGYAFESVKYQSWIDIWRSFYYTYWGIEFYKDPGYKILEKSIQLFVSSYRVFLILIAVFLFSTMGRWIYKNSRIPYVSYLLFSCLFYSFYAITGHRQTIATVLVVFIGDKFIREQKIIFFILITLIAATIHKSCVCFLPAYFIYQFKNYSQKQYIFALLIGIISLLFSQYMFSLAAKFLHYEDYLTNDTGGTGDYVFIYLCIVTITIIKFQSIIENNSEVYGTLNMILFGTLMVILSYFNQSFMRVQQYYTLYLMLLLPEIILSFKGRDRILVGFSGCVLLIIHIIINNPRYYLLWQMIEYKNYEF